MTHDFCVTACRTTASNTVRIDRSMVRCCHTTRCDTKIVVFCVNTFCVTACRTTASNTVRIDRSMVGCCHTTRRDTKIVVLCKYPLNRKNYFESEMPSASAKMSRSRTQPMKNQCWRRNFRPGKIITSDL
jgi:hypothetical protein